MPGTEHCTSNDENIWDRADRVLTPLKLAVLRSVENDETDERLNRVDRKAGGRSLLDWKIYNPVGDEDGVNGDEVQMEDN